MSVRFLSPEPLRVAERLNGRRLASPSRRAVAFALDFLLLLLPTIAVSLGAAALSVRIGDPKGYEAMARLWWRHDVDPESQHEVLRDLAPLLVQTKAHGLPAAVSAMVEAGDLDQAAALLADVDLDLALELGPDSSSPPRPGHVRLSVAELIPRGLRAAALFGVAAVYFTLLTRGRRGATLGKRLFGIRVVRLDGSDLSLRDSFERFSGYSHIPGSLGFALLDLWHDPNRRLPHDRVVHTAVVHSRPEAPAPATRHG